jgi:hypothetical protein
MRSYCLCQKEDVSRKWNGPCGREVARSSTMERVTLLWLDRTLQPRKQPKE